MTYDRSAVMREKWQDPEFRELMSQQLSKQWQDPELREKRITAQKKSRDVTIKRKLLAALERAAKEESK